MNSMNKVAIIFLSLVLAACGSSSTEPKVYSDRQECIADTGNAEQCDKWIAEAMQETPQFNSKEECESKFGQGACNEKQAGSGHSFFMPMMLGFLAGNMLSSNRAAPASGLYGNPANPEATKDARGNNVSRSGRLGNALSRNSRTNGGVSRNGFFGGGRAGS